MALFGKKRPLIDINKPDHIVVLDANWHKMFGDNKPAHIKNMEDKLNKLLKEQGKINTEYQQYKDLKKKLMNEIVENMSLVGDGNTEALALAKKNEKYIVDINKKIEKDEQRLLVLPSEISGLNKLLLVEGLCLAYEQMLALKNDKLIKDQEANRLHTKLVNLKAEIAVCDEGIASTYGFIHSVADMDLMEQLDKFYMGEEE